MINEVGIGLIGCGRAGMIHAHNFNTKIKGAKMIAVSDAVEERAKRAATELDIPEWTTNYKKLLLNPSVIAVIVAAPTQYHHDIVVDAANAGKHVFCEKPMAISQDECEDMIAITQKNNVKLQIGFMRRFDKNYIRAKEMIEGGYIGDVVLVKSLTRGPSTPLDWMFDISKSNGPLAEVNSHDIDTLRWFTGSEVKSLYALAGNYRYPQVKEVYPDFYDTVNMNIRMENGMLGNIDGAQGVAYGYDSRVDILGTKGSIQIGDLQDGTTLLYTKETGITGKTVESWMNLFEEAYLNEDYGFVNSIRNDTTPKVTGIDGMQSVTIVRAGNESIRNGEIIYLNNNNNK